MKRGRDKGGNEKKMEEKEKKLEEKEKKME
jgi:hypothetical protein